MESETGATRGSVRGSEWDQVIHVLFQMQDRTVICQNPFAMAVPVAALKQRALAEWPRDRLVIPKSLDDIRLEIDGKVLEDSETLAECIRSCSNRVADLITVVAAVNVRGEIQEATEPREQWIELKFRLHDGTDICHGSYPPSTTVAALKEMLIAEWPKKKRIIPESVDGLRLQLLGKILGNGRTLGESLSEHRHLISGEVITVHATVVRGIEWATSWSCCRIL